MYAVHDGKPLFFIVRWLSNFVDSFFLYSCLVCTKLSVHIIAPQVTLVYEFWIIIDL